MLLVSWTALATTYTLGPVKASTFWMSDVESVPEAEAAADGTVRATSAAELYVVPVPMYMTVPEADPAETLSENVTVQAPAPWLSEADERVGLSSSASSATLVTVCVVDAAMV